MKMSFTKTVKTAATILLLGGAMVQVQAQDSVMVDAAWLNQLKAELKAEVKAEIVQEMKADSVKTVAKEEEKSSTKGKGKVILNVFANVNSTFGSEQPTRVGFELERSYLGYQYDFANGVSLKAVADIGASKAVDDYQRIFYLKNAQVSWKYKGMTLSGGLISTTQFNLQEKHWGYRYILKSFQDLNKYGSSADLGLSVAYKFTNWFSADAIITTGDGYKKLQVDNGFNYGLGLTFVPVKGLTMRLYGGYNQKDAKGEKDAINAAGFIGYKHDRFSLGAEYNLIWNADYKQDANKSGLSVYGSVKAASFVDVFARFDDMYSTNDWNISKDNSLVLVGAQFKCGKYVKIAPNFRMEIPKNGAPCAYAAYVNCSFGL